MRSLLLIGFLGLGGSWAPAAVLLEFVAGSPSYQTVPGATVDIPIYLRETLSDGSSSLITSGGGLFSLGLAVSRLEGAAGITAFTHNANFFDYVVASGTTAFLATLWQEQDGIETPALPDADGFILAGTLTILAPGTAGTSTTFALEDYSMITDTTVTYEGGAIDGLIAPGTFTVATVPEPAAGALIGIALALVGLQKRKRPLLAQTGIAF